MRTFHRDAAGRFARKPEPYFPTKYDSAAHEVISYLASVSEGYGKAETGDSDSPTGYFALVILDDTCDLDFEDMSTNYPQGDMVGMTARTYGVNGADVKGAHIVTWNSQGFVSVETFETAQEAEEEFACRADAYHEWADEDRDDDWDGVYMCAVAGHGYHNVYGWTVNLDS